MAATRAGIRARREGWACEVEVALTVRDLEILLALGTCGVLRTRDLVRLFFGSRGTANDRLRKLYCAGYIDCHAPDLAGDNYYVLSERGRDLLLDHRDVDPGALRVVRKLPAKLDHLVAVNEFRIHVALACRCQSAYTLVGFETDADLSAERHATLLDLIPDAKVTVRSRTTGEVHAFLVEVDLGSEAVTWLVRRKLAAYAKHAAIGTALYGLRDPLVVVVVPGLRRARNIARLLTAQRVAARVVFALRPLLSEANVLGAAYALAADLVAAPPDATAEAIFVRRLLP